ncbi:putative kinesin light chain [Exophiala viscosa]|uniref:Kinesin light chain n=1 Tax=Exophiala viscosa TaxID=2486360 RepID=A0AAN6ICF3_9EURO|nr:putative kinesin light chain [Exophiala viscosa]
MLVRPIKDYRVGWVCALPKELTAARAMLDEEHDSSQVPNDNNSYVLGRIHGHNVVIACLPAGVYGTVSAATVANNMLRTFTGIRFGLMVGIGGGIPNLDQGVDIRLGDVVVSQPDGTHGGVVQYDFRKNLGDGTYERKGVLQPPPTFLLAALGNLQSRHQIHGNRILETIAAMVERFPILADDGFVHPGTEMDVLFCGNVDGHKGGLHCTRCQNGILERRPRGDRRPEVHYGTIASGNELMKNVVERDRLGRELGAKCVEMEAAGLMNEFPCIVVLGICDYADFYKNDVWQEYAAVTAAGFAKELLSIVKTAEVTNVKHATEATKHNRGLNLYDAPDMGDDLFCGRQAEIQQMESILQPLLDVLGASRKLLVLGGMGGIGKTQLAVSYAKRHRTSYTSIFWLDATSELSLKTSLRNVAHRALPPSTIGDFDDERMSSCLSNWLSEDENTRWLLIFDNYDDPEQYSVRKYLPSVAHGSVIITTRQPDRVLGDKVRVRSLSKEDDSLRILARRSERENVGSDPDARRLAQRLDGHPLALATAGAFLSQSAISFGQYLRRYEERWTISDAMEELPDYPSRTLYSTWYLSFMHIEQQNPRAAKLLRFLAYLDHRDIWFELLHCGRAGTRPAWFAEVEGDVFMFEDAMQTLTRYCLVETCHQTGSYSLHPCVQGKLGKAETMYIRALVGLEKVLGVDHESTIFVVHNLSMLYSDLGKLKEAETMCLRALAGRENLLGPDHRLTLSSVVSLGVIYVAQGKLGEAGTMNPRALAAGEKSLGLVHKSTLDSVNNLGDVYRDQGRLDEAEKMYKRALVGQEKELGLNLRSPLVILMNIGTIFCLRGELSRAEISGLRRTLGANHIDTLDAFNNLANLYCEQGKLEKAEALYEQALTGITVAQGKHHYFVSGVLNNLGLLNAEQGNAGAARRLYLEARDGFQKLLGPEHYHTRMVCYSLQQLDLGDANDTSLSSTGVIDHVNEPRRRWYY